MSDDRGSKSRAELLVQLLDAYSTWVGIGIFVLSVLFIIVLLTAGLPEIPRWWRVFIAAAVACAALGYLPVVKVLRYLYDPPRRFIVQPSLSEDEGGIWELSPAGFEDLTVHGGELYEWPGTKHPTYEVEWYNEEAHICKATWRGTASDGEMIRDQQKINEVRDYLEKRAKERDILITRAETIVREAVLENARLIVNEYNRASLVDVTALTDKVDGILDEADLTSELQDIETQRTDPDTDTEPETVNQPTQSPEAAADGGTEVNDV